MCVRSSKNLTEQNDKNRSGPDRIKIFSVNFTMLFFKHFDWLHKFNIQSK